MVCSNIHVLSCTIVCTMYYARVKANLSICTFTYVYSML